MGYQGKITVDAHKNLKDEKIYVQDYPVTLMFNPEFLN